MYIQTFKRKRGTVYKVSVHKFGRLIAKTFLRKHDAVQWGQMMEARESHDAPPPELTFQELGVLWFCNHAEHRKAPASISTDKHMCNSILPLIGHLKISAITGRDIEKLIAALKSVGKRSNSTINKFIRLVQTIFNYGVRNDYLIKNPVKTHHFLPEHEVGYQYWSEAEAEKFIAHVRQKYQHKNRLVALLYILALNTGMRWGELLALKWDAVHLNSDSSKSMITVKRSFCNRSKAVRETTKGHKIRYVGMNSVLQESLKKEFENRNPHSDFVFHTLSGTPLKIGNFHKRHFKRDIKEAGVSMIRFHDLRHTYASHFMMNSGSIYDLQKILGHSDVQTTMRYAHLSREHILNKAEIVVLGKKDNVVSVDFKKASSL